MNVGTQVDAEAQCTFQHRGLVFHFYRQGVEPGFMAQCQPGLLQPGGQNVGQTMDAPGDALQALRAMVHRIQAGYVGQQHLRGTDIRVGFFAADMLLTGLHRHAQRGVAGGIAGNTNDTARH
ncbi:hypothetical protein D3C80_1477370 [compost metagenome]